MKNTPEQRMQRIDDQLKTLHGELRELEWRGDDWDYKSPVRGKRYRAIAERLVLSAKRLEVLVREHSQIR